MAGQKGSGLKNTHAHNNIALQSTRGQMDIILGPAMILDHNYTFMI